MEELLKENVRRFNDTETLNGQLRLIERLSVDLVRSKFGDNSPLLLQLHRAQNSKDSAAFLTSSTEFLEALRPIAESDPIATVLARRAFHAILVLRAINSSKGALLDEDAEGQLRKIATEFYSLHVEDAARKGLVDYLHISKSGGTSFSAAAGLSKCNKTRGIGQPLYLGDLPHWINRTAFKDLTGGVHMTWSIYGRVNRTGEVQGCAQRLARIRRVGLQYVSNEYTLYGGVEGSGGAHVCPQGVNVVTLRDPDARMLSHLHFMLAHMKRRLVRGGGRPEREELFRRTFCSGNLSVWEAVAPAVMDNYVVRSFLGESGFHSPVGSIGDAALGVARQQLLQFDLVLDLGAGDEAANLIMRQGLGWNVTLAQVHSRSSEQVYLRHRYDKEECRNEGMIAAVAPRQQPDRMLYRMGRVLSFLDLLLLSMAQQLGLQPRPPPGKLGPEAATHRCGVVGALVRTPSTTPEAVVDGGDGAGQEAGPLGDDAVTMEADGGEEDGEEEDDEYEQE